MNNFISINSIITFEIKNAITLQHKNMNYSISTSSWFFTVFSFLLAILGGVYFGLFPCGGYEKHWYLYLLLLVIITSISIILPPLRLKSTGGRFLIFLIISNTFIIIRASLSPFYPDIPEDFYEYIQLFFSALSGEIC